MPRTKIRLPYVKDGKEYHHITDILSVISKGSKYDYWIAKNGLKESHRISQDAANRGTRIHNLVHKVLTGRPLKVPQELEGYMEAFDKFWAYLGLIEPYEQDSEEVVYSEKGYAGTIDYYFKDVDRCWTLVDFKTGKNIYSEHSLQVSAYAKCLFETHKIYPQKVWLLHLRPSGEFLPMRDIYEVPTWWKLVPVVEAAFEIYKWRKNCQTYIHPKG